MPPAAGVPVPVGVGEPPSLGVVELPVLLVAPPVLGVVDDMAAPMRACDLIVLPYDVEQYDSKGSGILAQARALGIPVTAPFGTLPGRLIEQHRIGPLFVATTPQAIYGVIKFADHNYASYAANALMAAQQFVKHNGVAHFASAFLAAAGLPKPLE